MDDSLLKLTYLFIYLAMIKSFDFVSQTWQ